jgi:glucose-1-phosphate thymidylyltransferase
MGMRKGIILAGGKGSRLYPMTQGVNKQLQSVYDKPMIYYPLSTLMNAAIKDILIISSPDQLPLFRRMFRSGNQLGINIEYAAQSQPRGLADAFLVGEKFLDGDPCALVLGDNIFYGDEFYKDLTYISKMNENCVFGYRVSNPSDYGVVDFERPEDPYDLDVKVNSIEEKPDEPKSNYAVPGLYFYDNTVVDRVKSLEPSHRGELEITDLNNSYIRDKKLTVKLIKETAAWFDTGSPDQMFEAAMFVKSIQSRTGQMIACLEEIAFKRRFISKDQFHQTVLLTIPDGCEYKRYLRDKYEMGPLCVT